MGRDNGSRESDDDTRLILPRQGEVAPQVTDGEEHETYVVAPSPSVWQEPATSPWRGRIERFAKTQRPGRCGTSSDVAG